MASTALAKNEPQVLTLIRQDPVTAIIEQYDNLEAVANVTFPPTALDNLPPMHKPSPTVIRVNTDQQSKDTYTITRDQLGLSKHVVLKMLTASGASWRTRKLSPDSDLDNIRWTADVWRRLPDGTLQVGQGSKAWNWQKCQEKFIKDALARGKTEADGMRGAAQYREFADEQTETKALLRAARAILNIKTSYTPAELQKPFLFLRVVPDLDTSDPEIKRMLAQKMIDSTFAIYGQPDAAPALPPVTLPDPPAEPTDDEFGDDDAPAPSEFAEAAPAAPPQSAGIAADWDPFAEQPLATPEEEVNEKVTALAKRLGKERFPKALARAGVQNLKAATHDQKLILIEMMEAVLAGRLTL